MRKEDISGFLRWFLKTVLIMVGFIIIIMPFFPAFMEYTFDAQEKEFGAKEVLIVCLGILIFTGGIFSNTILKSIKSRVSKIINP